MRTTVVTALLFATTASAGAPVIFYEQKVSQFRDAAAGVKNQLPEGVDVDVASADSSRLADATVIVAIGKNALKAAREKAPRTPTVFCLALGVTREQLSDAVTGVPLEPDPADTLSRLKEVVPTATKIGLIYNPASSDWFYSEAVKAASRLNLTLVSRSVGSPQEVREAARSLLGSADLLWLPPDPALFPKDMVLFLLTLSAERQLPVIGFLDSLTQAGALASMSADYAEVGRRAGKLAAEIASRPDGKRTPVPASVWAPGRLTLNMKTAETLGIKPSSAAQKAAVQTIR